MNQNLTYMQMIIRKLYGKIKLKTEKLMKYGAGIQFFLRIHKMISFGTV